MVSIDNNFMSQGGKNDDKETLLILLNNGKHDCGANWKIWGCFKVHWGHLVAHCGFFCLPLYTALVTLSNRYAFWKLDWLKCWLKEESHKIKQALIHVKVRWQMYNTLSGEGACTCGWKWRLQQPGELVWFSAMW